MTVSFDSGSSRRPLLLPWHRAGRSVLSLTSSSSSLLTVIVVFHLLSNFRSNADPAADYSSSTTFKDKTDLDLQKVSDWTSAPSKSLLLPPVDNVDADKKTDGNASSSVLPPVNGAAVDRPAAANDNHKCSVVPTDPYQINRLKTLVDKPNAMNLIELHLKFPNDSVNPLTVNLTNVFKGNIYSRVSSKHGQTLLSLAFNYGILSLMTLTLGTDSLDIDLEERPHGCLVELDEKTRIDLVVKLMMKDFQANPTRNITLKGEERICYEIVINNGRGRAAFSDRCCFPDQITGRMICEENQQNGWLTFLYVLLALIRFGILAFGPLLFLSTVTGLVREEFPYTVKLKDPLVKTIVFYRKEPTGNAGGGGSVSGAAEVPLSEIKELKGKRTLDLTCQRGFPKLRKSIDDLVNNSNSPERLRIGQPFRAKFTEYDIKVNYKRLVTENKVPVGFWRSVVRSLFFCKLRQVGPFKRCCRADMLSNETCRRSAEKMYNQLTQASSGPCPCCCCCTRSGLSRHSTSRGRARSLPKMPWINLWRRIGMMLLIILLPTPYYIRLFIMYSFEYNEVIMRKEAAARLNLRQSFENSLIHYLLPSHPIFILIYVIYVVMAFNLAYLARRNEQGRFRRIIIGSFTDLKNLSWIKVLKMMVANIIWPFQKYGLAGCLLVIVYWPIVLPLTSIVYAFYCLPTVYLTVRMFFYSKMAFLRRISKRATTVYQVRRHEDDSVHYFEAENITKYLLPAKNGLKRQCVDDNSSSSEDSESESAPVPREFRRTASTRSTAGGPGNRFSVRESVLNSDELDEMASNIDREKLKESSRKSGSGSTVVSDVKGSRVKRVFEHLLASLLCVLALYSLLVVLSECVGCMAEIFVFTLMGIIVNAGSLLKYVALVVMLIVYSYECFNNVEKKYLKLNKALFSEVKGRVKDLDKVTSLPSFLQENCGFKSQELGEQAEYELSDDVIDKPPRHWLINDLVLFIDNEDMPRIPRMLFEKVCKIRVAGVPGPVYRGQLTAVRQFLRIVVFIFFVFVVICSFGSVYEVSNTNQMLAALAGGSLPFILRMVMEPEKPDIEIGTVSFKSQLDEVIKNFAQLWPIYDLPFAEYTAEEEENDRKKAEEEQNKSGGGSGPGDGGTIDRRTNVAASNNNDSARKNSMERRRSDAIRTEAAVSALTTVIYSADDSVDGTAITSVPVVNTSSPGQRNSTFKPPPVVVDVDDRKPSTVSGDDTVMFRHRSPTKVCFEGELNDVSPTPVKEPEVDLVIYLPSKKYDDLWIDDLFEPSNLDSDLDDLDYTGSGSPDDYTDVFVEVDRKQSGQSDGSSSSNLVPPAEVGVPAPAYDSLLRLPQTQRHFPR